MAALELSEEQGVAVTKLDAAMAKIGEGFEDFVVAAKACEDAGVPMPVLQGKAMEMQQLVMRQMTGG